MDKEIFECKLKELFMLKRSLKLEAIIMLIENIADDKVYEAIAAMETEREYNEQK